MDAVTTATAAGRATVGSTVDATAAGCATVGVRIGCDVCETTRPLGLRTVTATGRLVAAEAALAVPATTAVTLVAGAAPEAMRATAGVTIAAAGGAVAAAAAGVMLTAATLAAATLTSGASAPLLTAAVLQSLPPLPTPSTAADDSPRPGSIPALGWLAMGASLGESRGECPPGEAADEAAEEEAPPPRPGGDGTRAEPLVGEVREGTGPTGESLPPPTADVGRTPLPMADSFPRSKDGIGREACAGSEPGAGGETCVDTVD